jgi:thiol:disulfide interchange protein DsbA
MFSVAIAAALLLAAASHAQTNAPTVAPPANGGMWVEGRHYKPVGKPQPTSVVPGKVEVLEFFSYGCPNCYAFEPVLERWERQKPVNAVVRRVPIAWDGQRLQLARLYHTLVVLKRTDLHDEVFDHIHGKVLPLIAEDDAAAYKLQAEFARTHGVNEKAFKKAYESKAVVEMNEQARKLMYAYQIASLPTVVVNGRYFTDLTMARNETTFTALLNDLVKMETPASGAQNAL